MAKRKIKVTESNNPNIPNLVNESEESIKNGLGGAIGFGQFNAFNFPQNSAFPGTEQVSNVNTIFKNLRWFLVSNFRQVVSEAYVELGLVQTITNVPVDDALRGGVEIKSQQLDEDQISELQISLDRDGDIRTVGQAAKWNRLFGGAGVVIMTDQDPEEEFELDQVTFDTPLNFRAVDMWELFWDKQNTEGYDPSIQSQDFTHYNYYGELLHRTHVMKMTGLIAPSFIRPRLRGWGFSVLEILVRSLNQYLKATDLGFEVLDEFKLDVYKIKNLVNTLLSPNGQQKIQQRVQMANWQKNYQNAIVMDSEDDFDHKQLSFAGLAEAMAGIRMQVAADMRMPITKLFGQSVSGGLGNSDQNDMENYNAMVESEVREKIKYDILRVLEIKCQKLFGFVPDDLEIAFKALRVLSAIDEENVKTQKFNRAIQAQQAGLISTIEFRETANKGNLFDIRLDTGGDSLNPNDPQVREIVKEGADSDPLNPIDEKDPGANREDTQKSIAMEPQREKMKKANTDEFDESKHPRGEGGKFGAGGKGKQKKSVDHTAEIERLHEEAEKAEDGNSHHKAEVLREKARKLEKEMKSGKKKNSFIIMPKAFTRLERIERVLKNSIEFDKASYEADGGDAWIHPGREEFFTDPMNVDKGLWAKAKEESMKAFGKHKWQFVTWIYKKQGGRFT